MWRQRTRKRTPRHIAERKIPDKHLLDIHHHRRP